MTSMMSELPWPLKPNPCPECIFIARIPNPHRIGQMSDLYVCEGRHVGSYGTDMIARRRVVVMYADGARVGWSALTSASAEEPRVKLALALAKQWGIWP